MTDDADWLVSARVAIVAGKGGVGSSTTAAACALAAARAGADVLFIAVDGRPGMGPLLGGDELDDRDQLLQKVGSGRIRGQVIPPDQAFGEYLDLKGVGGLLRRAASAASLPMIAAATPGLEHLLVLGKIKELDKDRAADLIVVDAPPAGHVTPFLRSATGLSDVVRSGPVLEQATEVGEMLHDSDRCRAMIVTIPEETPVTEALELASEIRDDVGIALLPTVLNACWPERDGLAKSPAMAARSHKLKLSDGAKAALATSSDFGRRRLERQRHQHDRLVGGVGEPVIELPRLPSPRLGPDDLAVLADALVADETEDGE
jgi:anion-transporting  ArsA/GET3 family ATPase